MQQQFIDSDILAVFPTYKNEIRVFDPLEKYNATPYTPKPYEVSDNIISQHGVPRFGHTNNITALLSGLANSNSNAATDYIVGICAFAMLIAAIALVWGLAIVILKSLGREKVDFFAGRLEHPDFGKEEEQDSGTLPSIPEEPSSEQEIESLLEADANSPLILSQSIDRDIEEAKLERKFNRKVFVVRITFVLSGLAVIAAGAVFYAKGIQQFRASLYSVHTGLELVQNTANQAINIIDNVVIERDNLQSELRKAMNKTGESFCEGEGELANEIGVHLEELHSEIEDMVQAIEDSIVNFGNDLRTVVEIAEDVNNKLTSADIMFWIAIAISIIIGVLIMTMLVVTYFSAKGVSNCCTKFTTNAVLWPVFIFFLVLFWILALLFLVTSLAGADFCMQPDEVVQALMYRYQDMFHSAIFEFLIFYISGCTIVPSKESEMQAISEDIYSVLDTVHGFSELVMGAPIGQIEGQCGLDQAGASALQGGAELLHETAHAINNGFIETRTLLECKNFNSIYITFIHDALCVEGVNGLTWLYSSSMAIFLFAMTMITFRAALYPVKRRISPQAPGPAGLNASLLNKGDAGQLET